MYRYLIVVLFIHSYNCSILRTDNIIAPNANTELGKALVDLTKSCKNAFLVEIIQNRINECDLPVPPHKQKQFNCLLFYDMNTQLCSAINSGQFILNKDEYEIIINENVNVSTICKNAQNWKPTVVKQFLRSMKLTDKVFKRAELCYKMCLVDDFLTEESNFYCKYYNWGSNIIKQSPAPITVNNTKIDNVVKDDSTNDIPKTYDKDQGSIVQPNLKENVENIASANVTNIPTSNATTSSISEASSPQAGHRSIMMPQPEQPSSSSVIPKSELQPYEQQQPSHMSSTQLEVVKEFPKNEEDPIISDKIDAKSSDNLIPDKKDAVLDTPNLKSDVNDDEEFQENDSDFEEKEPAGDMKNEDPSFEDPEEEKLLEQNKKINNRIELPAFTGEINQRDPFPSNLQEGFSDDDDHFFSFFLTAVILVILLYVLYHNKSKVSKVVLGLIVEGRQPGRRRGSRGHAYRKLDTLEQAMSSNTPTAPPSKIIY